VTDNPLPDNPLPDRAEIPSTSTGWLVGSGEMATLVRAFDWASTPLGPVQSWSPALRMTVGLMLANRVPMLLWWGADYISIYNDAYRPVLGSKHPWALGKPCFECWEEIQQILRPLIDAPFNGGPATWMDDILLEIHRHGFFEETHFTISYSPVPDETAPRGIGGVLAVVYETTEKIIAERRVEALRDLGARSGEAKTAEMACAIAAETLANYEKDFPFVLFYLIDPDGKRAWLAAASGVERGNAASPEVIELDECLGGSGAWPLSEAVRNESMVTIDDLRMRFTDVPPGPWSDPPQSAAVIPIRSNKAHELAGLMVAGLSSRLKFDPPYRSFLELAATQVANAIATARAYEEERKRAEALAEIDRAKTIFFSNVSHEFRTPLTLMLGPLEELKGELSRADGLISARQYQRLDLAHRNGLRLLKLVNTLLDFSRIEAGRERALYEPTDLAAATTELASMFRSAVEKAGLRLIVDCEPLSEVAYVDREMWEKIVLNLLSNAFKFTFAGQIELMLRQTDEDFVLAVRDTGTGIPSHELPKLFERFHRVAGAQGRSHEGSGIGLAFVQELVKLHGGTVSVESSSGKGTTFTINIPRGHSHLPAEQIGAARTSVSTVMGATAFVEEALRWLSDGEPTGHEIIADATNRDSQPVSGERPYVLLADDNSDMREYVRRLLEPNYQVEVAVDGEAARAAIARRKPDLLLADVMMPRLDGMQLLARLRSDPQTNTLPVILLSARAGEESRVEGMQSGADDYLIKPFSARELLARVEAHLKMARFRDEAAETLRASEERYRAFVTASSDVVYRMSPDWSEMRFLHGRDFVADTKSPSRSWLQTYIRPDDQSRMMQAVQQAISNKSIFELEHPVIRVDGTTGWTHSRAIPLLGAGGEIIEWFGAARDISERKQAEETQQLLIGELNHRVKNILASVQAIMQQTLRRTQDPAAFAESFAGRIQSLARVHSMLTASTWKGAELRSVIGDQLLHGPVDETRITARGPGVYLEPQMTLHIALMLHELGTNAAKHGALSTPDGRVTIGWTVKDQTLQLRWEERGGPPSPAPATRGFGTTLIEQSARSEGGSARMLAGPNGVVWEIALQLPRPSAGSETSPLSPPESVPKMKGQPLVFDTPRDKLVGKRFLVVEDEPLVALDLSAALEQAGAEVIASTGSADKALEVIESRPLDAALLDGNLNGRPVDDIAAALMRRNIPFAFVTGYGRESLPKGFASIALLTKPFSESHLLDIARQLVDCSSPVSRAG
jgi:signal transduction histidine kinase/DNA-binding response OmpR family regulator